MRSIGPPSAGYARAGRYQESRAPPLAVMETMRRLPTDPFADLMVTQSLATDDAMWLRCDCTTGAVRTGALTADEDRDRPT